MYAELSSSSEYFLGRCVDRVRVDFGGAGGGGGDATTG
jgi:hypothetical protein